jgi:allophanate hydrolase
MNITDLKKLFAKDKNNVRRYLMTLYEQIIASPPAIWIYIPSQALWEQRLVELEDLMQEECAFERYPLLGIPFSVKDNLDIKGWPTSAACPQFTYIASETSPVIEQLWHAGAFCVGKTNMDQFATGLVGMRSPMGVPPNPYNAHYIPGGSSSGSASSVAHHLAVFALGTDTAGSGRVPAAFMNLVGLKPTRGLLSSRGMVPACKSLDCASVFTHNTQDAAEVFRTINVYDAQDPIARPMVPTKMEPLPQKFKFAIPQADQLQFFGEDEYEDLYAKTVKTWENLGGVAVEIDYAPFYEAAQLLYKGPWIAERLYPLYEFIMANKDAVLKTTASILLEGTLYSAVDYFKAHERLLQLRIQVLQIMQSYEFLLLPTAGRHFTLAEVEQEPISCNQKLGYYTNFVNLLDMCALALPAGWTKDKRPFGVTLISKAMDDHRLLQWGIHYEQSFGASGYMELVVVGWHMQGLKKNFELIDLGGEFVRSVQLAPVYSLWAFSFKGKLLPGLVKGFSKGSAIVGEVWRIPLAHVGAFLKGVPSSLALGRVELDSGEELTGFLCEPFIAMQGEEITHLGGWRAYINTH